MRRGCAALGGFSQFTLAVLVAALCGGVGIGAARRLEPSKWAREPLFTVPRLAGGVRVDSVLADNEWEGATSVSAVFDASVFAQSVQPITFWLGHGGQALYLAFRMQRPKGSEHPRITDKTKGYTDKKLFQVDDNLEVWLAPLTEGVTVKGMMHPQYAVAANAAGAYYHVMTRHAHEKVPRHLEYAAHLNYNIGQWQGELKFPWTIFEVMDVEGKRPPADGVEWKAVVFFHQVTPAKNWLGLQPRLRTPPTLRFSERPIGYSVSALELKGQGRAAFEVAVRNGSRGAAAYELDYEIFRRNAVPRSRAEHFISVWEQIQRIQDLGARRASVKPDEVQYVKTVEKVEAELNEAYRWVDGGTRAIAAPPGKRAVCKVEFDAPDGYYVLRYELREKATGRAVLRQVIPACLFRMALEVKPEFLLKQMIVARANVGGLRALAKGDPVRFSLKDAKGASLEEETVRWDGGSQIVQCLLPTAKTKDGGTYTVGAEALHGGATIGGTAQSVTRPPTPEWSGNTLGTTKKIPWGYKPIGYADDGFELVLRKYVMGGKAFPQQILSRGEPLLAGPIELTGAVGGKPLAFRHGPVKFGARSETEASFEQELRGDGLVVKVRARLEYDGFLRYDLELRPAAGGTTLEKLALHIPVRARYVQWFAHQALSTDLSGHPAPAYPYGALADFLEDHPDGWIPFTWRLYLGCRDRGIEWVAESDREWSPASERRMIRVAKDGGRVTMTFQFVDKPVALKAPRALSFGITATPVRHYTRKRYYQYKKAPLSFSRKTDWKRLDRTLLEHKRMGFNAYGIYINAHDINLFSNARYYDKETLDIFTRYARAVHKHGHTVGYYCGYGLPHGIPHDDTFGSEMRMEPVRPSGWYNHASPFRDYWLHSVKFMCERCGLDGIQTDGIAVVPLMTNPTYGFEWLRNGRRHGTHPVFAVRELMKRLYLMLKFELEGGREGFHMVHCDRPPVFCVDAWGDWALSGEAHHHTVTSLRELFPDRYGVFYDNLEQGVAPYALWGYGFDLAVTRNMAYTLHHLHGILKSYAARLGAYGPAYTITGGFREEAEMWHSFGLAEADYKPYWQHADLVKVESDDLEVTIPDDAIHVTAFVHPGREALLIVANLDRLGYTLKLTPNLAKLGLPGDLSQYTVRDPIYKAGIFSRPKLRVDVHPQRWRAIHIQRRK